jgi:DNA-binding transcriptional LysR family regulator
MKIAKSIRRAYVMDLKQLRYFVAVAEESHITRAAERLGMQQPPLSAQIKAIEADIGVQLFRRKPRGVELTAAGRELLMDGRDILARMERAVQRARQTARGEIGNLCVAIAPTAPFNKIVPRAIRNFRKAYPLVSLTLEEGLSNEVVAGLINQRIDVAFVRNSSIHAGDLATIPLLNEPMIVALPSHHALVKSTPARQPIALAQLRNEPFIFIGPPGTGLHDETIAACRRAGYSPRPGQQAPRITSALGLVAAEMGVVLIPESLKALRVDGIVYRNVKGLHPPRAFLGLTFLRINRSEAIKKFIATVRAARTAMSDSDMLVGAR